MAGAYAYRSGVIVFYDCEGTIVLCGSPRVTDAEVLDAVSGMARLSYDGVTWLVPGLPEAQTDQDANDAVEVFAFRLRKRLGISTGYLVEDPKAEREAAARRRQLEQEDREDCYQFGERSA
jgi:hypothetical protein